MRFLVVLILLLLAACSSAREPVVMHVGHQASITKVRPVLVDHSFDAIDRESIELAVYEWNAVLSGTIRLETHTALLSIEEMMDPDAILVLKVDSTCTFIPTSLKGIVLAWTNKIGGNNVWLIRDRLGTWQVHPVMAHELGHVFGADDREGPGLMHWQADMHEYRCIDKATVEEVAKWQKLPMNTLGYCE